MFDIVSLVAVFTTFFIAGTVKGVIGLGLPTVSLALLTVAIDLPSAMALLLVPSFVTNIWQALVGGSGKVIFLRIWPFLLLATGTVWIGATALTRVDLQVLSALLGALLIAYSLLTLSGFRVRIPGRHQTWTGLLFGTANGLLTGMSGSFVVPGVMFLQAIGLPRDKLVQAMGMLFTLSTLALALALHGNNLLTIQLGTLSAASLLPAAIGMVLGQKIRQNLSEQLFQNVFFTALMILGIYIIANAYSGYS